MGNNKKVFSLLLITIGIIVIVGACAVQFFPAYFSGNFPFSSLSQKEEPEEPAAGLKEKEPSFSESQAGSEQKEETGEKNNQQVDTGEKEPAMKTLGVMKIEKIDLEMKIVEGSGEKELMAGLGHVQGTAGIGSAGNCAIAGHRNYIRMQPFRHLDKMAAGDLIQIRTGKDQYTYKVYKKFIVEPKDVWVLEPEKNRKILTLITCHPVINPKKRLIVQAELE